MQQQYLASKPRYEILDGLRGVAAIIVIIFHLFETYSKGVPYQILNHGYLAVDFFFVLSGFVIGYAYDDRWNKMTVWGFCKRRLVRLHPMIILGALIGMIFFYFGGDVPEFKQINEVPWYTLVGVTILTMLMIPILTKFDIRGWNEMQPTNGAMWSLFWEYIANIMYALVIRHMSKIVLGIFIAIAAVFTVTLCMNIDIFGLLATRDYAAYTVIGGWSLAPDQILIGLTRLIYPFFAGLLLSRVGFKVKIRGGFWWCSLAVVILLVMPRVGGTEEANFWMNGLYEAISIILLFPLVVAFGAGSEISDKHSVAVCKFLGEISYPLYIVHYPFIYMQMSWAATHQDLPASTHVMVAVSIFILAICVAYASLKVYDIPVREWLKNKILINK